MTNEQLLAEIKKETEGAASYRDKNLSSFFNKVDYYFNAEAKGELAAPKAKGVSKIVSTDVADTIEWMLPSILRVFNGGEDVVIASPVGEGDADTAEVVTKYLNHIFTKDNDGYMLLYKWFKDALMYRYGVLKAYYYEEASKVRQEYKGLDEAEAQALLDNAGTYGDYEILELTKRDDLLIDVAIKRELKQGRVKVEFVHVRHFGVSKHARSMEDARFFVHHCRKSKAEVRARYKVEDLNDAQDLHGVEHDTEDSNNTIDLNECYLLTDYNKDGIEEWRRVVVARDKILENVEVLDHPFAVLCPIPSSSSLYGTSITDLVMPVQRNNTQAMRMLNDGVSKAVRGRMKARINGAVMEDLTDPRISGVVRVESMDDVAPLNETPLNLPAVLQYKETNDDWLEKRSGWTRYSQGLSPDALNQTATGVNIITNRGDMRIEAIARMFAETGVRTLFKKIYALVVRYQDDKRVIRVADAPLEVNPAEFAEEYDITINVGVGSGNKDQVLAHLMALGGTLEKAAQAGIVGPRQVYAFIREVGKAMQLKNINEFVKDPNEMEPKGEEPPTPQEENERIKLELEREKLKIEREKLDLDLQKAQAEYELSRIRLANNQPPLDLGGSLMA